MRDVRYVAIDGPDGCGKSTLARAVTARLAEHGRDVVHVREPGSTAFAERLRAVLLDPAIGELDPVSEALAFSAARRELLCREIRPALARGATVVSERCFASTWVYQGAAPPPGAPRIDAADLLAVTAAVHGDVRPDLLLILDLPVAEAGRRLTAGGVLDRIEARGDDFRSRVHAAFRELGTAGGSAGLGAALATFLGGADRVRTLDATLAPAALTRVACQAIAGIPAEEGA